MKVSWKQIEYSRALRKNQTQAEAIVWDLLRNRRFMDKKFLRQHPISISISGQTIFYILDFYCLEHKIGVELDGKIHEKGDQPEYDKFREKEIKEQLSIDIIRFRNEY